MALSSTSALTVPFLHAGLQEDFAIENLIAKGPRANADVGQPRDASLTLGGHLEASGSNTIRAGSWWCSAGGWPSLEPRTTTEIFWVVEGHGCVTDLDGERHYFGPGDAVILPQGWAGRWDVLQDLHKIWFVHDHDPAATTAGINTITRAQIAHNYHMFDGGSTNDVAPLHDQHGVRGDAIHGSPSTTSRILYEGPGPTQVGVWTCSKGSFYPREPRATTECFVVLEGVFFLTNQDGSA